MKKKRLKKIIKLFIFFIIISLPFVTITQMIGMNTFLDSFENPDSYICVQGYGEWIGTEESENKYVVIQRASHPDFTFDESDSVIYFTLDGELECSRMKQKDTFMNSVKSYSSTNSNEKHEENIYENQIIGKIVNTIDDNIWNSLSLSIWEISIHNLNIRALMTE